MKKWKWTSLWTSYPFLSPGTVPKPGIEPRSSTLRVDSLPAEPQGKPKNTGVGVAYPFSSGSFWPRSPWVGKIPWRRKWQPTPVLLPGESHGLRILVGYSPWGRKESDTTEWLHFHFQSCIAGGFFTNWSGREKDFWKPILLSIGRHQFLKKVLNFYQVFVPLFMCIVVKVIWTWIPAKEYLKKTSYSVIQRGTYVLTIFLISLRGRLLYY